MNNSEKFQQALSELDFKLKSARKIVIKIIFKWLIGFGIIFSLILLVEQLGLIKKSTKEDTLTGLIVLPLGCVMIGYVLSTEGQQYKILRKFRKSAFSHYSEITETIDSDKPYALYLGEFTSSKNVKWTREEDASYPSFGNARVERILNYLEKYLPVFYLANWQGLNDNAGGRYLLSSDRYWVENFIYLSDKARFIVFDYSSLFLSENVKTEIQHVLTLRKRNVILFCTKDQEKELLSYFPELRDVILYINYYYIITEQKDLDIVEELRNDLTKENSLRYYRGDYVKMDDALATILTRP